jgi:hypothetical protein
MKKVNFDFIPPRLGRWTMPGIGMAFLLALSVWGGNWARFLLFGHHLFWFMSFILLINPVVETFWPTPSKARYRANLLKRGPGPASETATERLAHLKRAKATVDKKLEKLNDRSKTRDK